MYGHRIYLKLADHINNVAYPVEAPEYSVIKAQAFEDDWLTPFSIPDKSANIMTRISIATMIDLCDRVIRFKILYAKDIIEIQRYLEVYVEQLQEYTSIKEVAEYILKARALLSKLEISMNILSKTHADVMKRIHDRDLLALFASGDTIGK